MELLTYDALRKIFELIVRPDENGAYSIDSIATLITLRNTCLQFRETIDSINWKINSIQVEKDDVEGVPVTQLAGNTDGQINPDLITSVFERQPFLRPGNIINLANQCGLLQVSEVNFKLHQLEKGQQADFLADLSTYLNGKIFNIFIST